MANIWQPSNRGELYHYGVIGMKWGVHKAYRYNNKIGSNHWKRDLIEKRARKKGETVNKDDPRVQKLNAQNKEYAAKRDQAAADAASRSKAHLQYLNARYQKKQAKAAKAYLKAEQKANSVFSTKRSAERAFRKASKAQFKANKAAYKGKDFYQKMMKEMGLGKGYDSRSVFYNQIDKETRNLGKEFIKRVERQSKAMYNTQWVGR